MHLYAEFKNFSTERDDTRENINGSRNFDSGTRDRASFVDRIFSNFPRIRDDFTNFYNSELFRSSIGLRRFEESSTAGFIRRGTVNYLSIRGWSWRFCEDKRSTETIRVIDTSSKGVVYIFLYAGLQIYSEQIQRSRLKKLFAGKLIIRVAFYRIRLRIRESLLRKNSPKIWQSFPFLPQRRNTHQRCATFTIVLPLPESK